MSDSSGGGGGSPAASRPDPLALIGVTAFALAAFLAVFLGLREGRPTLLNDTFEYAQVARNIANGVGIRTSAATVYEVWFMAHAGLPLPYYLHDLGNSLLLSVFFALFGARNEVIALYSGAFFVGLAPLTYLLGRRLFDRRTSVLAALLLAVNPHLLLYSTTGYSEVPLAFFFTLVVYLAFEARSKGRLFATGLAYGFYVLLRSSGLTLLPWLLASIVWAGREGEAPARGAHLRVLGLRSAAFLAGLAMVLVPNAARNYAWTGNVLHATGGSSLIHHTSAVSGKASQLLWAPGGDVDALGFAIAHPGEIVDKMAWQLSRTALHFVEGGLSWNRDFTSSLYLFLFLLAIVAPGSGEDRPRRGARYLVLAGLLSILVVGAAFHLRWRHLYGFLPVMILYAASCLSRLTAGARAGASTPVIVLLLSVYGLGPVLASVGDAERPHRSRNQLFRQLARQLRDATPADAVVLLDTEKAGTFSGMGSALAWYGERSILQFGDYVLESEIVAGSARPVFALRVDTGERSGPPGLENRSGFHRLDDWRLRSGKATLFRYRPEDP